MRGLVLEEARSPIAQEATCFSANNILAIFVPDGLDTLPHPLRRISFGRAH
jgi:hypothetical protein